MAMVRTPSSTPVVEPEPQAARDRASSSASTRQVILLIFVYLLFLDFSEDCRIQKTGSPMQAIQVKYDETKKLAGRILR